MAIGNTNFGNDQGTGTVGADGFLGPIGSPDAPSPVYASFVSGSVADGLTAAGTNRGTALALTAAINVVSTAAASTGVVLPDAPIGATVSVFNNGANAIKVYAQGSQTVDGTAGATGATLTKALRCNYTRTTATKWLSAQLGAVSA